MERIRLPLIVFYDGCTTVRAGQIGNNGKESGDWITMATFQRAKITTTLAILAALALLLLGLAAPAYASEPAPDPATAEYEIDFMTGMIDHHAMAVHMAHLCMEKAVHEELRSLCEDIMAAQSAEIDRLQTWLVDWYGVEHEPTMSDKHHRMMERLASYSGAKFEIRFMKMMIRHHQMAIEEAQMCLENAYHPELLSLCENIIATQSAEIEQMQSWLCEWYGRCEE